MESIPIIVKHQGKKYDVEVDPTTNGEVFKYQLFSLTDVEPHRQKVLIKGTLVKDHTEMGGLGLKAGQTIMLMGTPSGAGADLVRPKEPVKFIEDMTEAEAAQQEGASPAGLVNLGNTCYLNSGLQLLRAIPEIQTHLAQYPTVGSADLTSQLARLYENMSKTQEGVPPLGFLSKLRSEFPRFAERGKDHNEFRQQDAEEALTEIIGVLRQNLKVKTDGEETGEIVIDKYMTGEFECTMECDDPAAKEAGEEAVVTKEPMHKLPCHIDGSINHLRDGIVAGLKEKLEKNSEVLGTSSTYTKTSRISRMPQYLIVQFVRFFWRRDTQKNAKIMRKVTFPHELDLVEYAADGLKEALIPVRDKVRELRKEELDIERARKRRRNKEQDVGTPAAAAAVGNKAGEPQQRSPHGNVEMTTSADGAGDEASAEKKYKTDAEVEAEEVAALHEVKRELLALVKPEMAADKTANKTGLYELRAVIAHQGASADSGHYTAFVKKTATPDKDGKKGEEDGNWWWFNDTKVTEVTPDRIDGLSGGGEAASALILLYRAVPLPENDAETK